MVRRPSTASWRVAAESPHRSPVLHAVGEMTRAVRARGDDMTVVLWGPKDGAWHLFGTPESKAATASPPGPAESPEKPGNLTERMAGRRHQVLLAGLSKAGLYDLAQEDTEAVQALVERLDEPTVRRVAHWLAAAGGQGVLP